MNAKSLVPPPLPQGDSTASFPTRSHSGKSSPPIPPPKSPEFTASRELEAARALAAEEDDFPTLSERRRLTPEEVLAARGYSKGHLLGRGAFGQVFAATAPGGVPVAVKIIPYSQDPELRGESGSQNSAERELAALDLLKQRPHTYLIHIHAFWIEAEYLYIVMERADSSLKDRKDLQRPELLRIFAETAEALDYLHDNEIVHRDIKPANILLLGGHAKVADMDLAKTVHFDVAETTMGLGTPLYMAPEIRRGESRRESDQYALALSYGELRLGRHVVRGKTEYQVFTAHAKGQYDLEGLLPHEEAAIRRALSQDPKQRFATCLDFVRALEPAALSSSQTSNPSPLGKIGSRGYFWPALIGLLLTLPVVVLLLMIALKKVEATSPTTPAPEETSRIDWPPAATGLVPVQDSPIRTVNGKRLAERLTLNVNGKHDVVFCLVHPDLAGDPGAFYLMENKVWHGLFAEAFTDPRFKAWYAADRKRYDLDALGEEEWKNHPYQQDPLYPALGVNFFQADCFARWLCDGMLPTREQWEKAATRKNPFRPDDDPNPPEKWAGFAVNRAKQPQRVGEAGDDVSVYGCRDMAGNGCEWTSLLRNKLASFNRTESKEQLRNEFAYVMGHAFDEIAPFPIGTHRPKPWGLHGAPWEMLGFRVVLPVK